MRHGIPWWETFWKWLLKDSRTLFLYVDADQNELYLDQHLKDMKLEFEELWREGSVVPPKG